MNPGGHRGDLDDVADDEDSDTNTQTASTAKPIGSVSSKQGTGERSKRHCRDDQGRDGGIKRLGAIRLSLADQMAAAAAYRIARALRAPPPVVTHLRTVNKQLQSNPESIVCI